MEINISLTDKEIDTLIETLIETGLDYEPVIHILTDIVTVEGPNVSIESSFYVNKNVNIFMDSAIVSKALADQPNMYFLLKSIYVALIGSQKDNIDELLRDAEYTVNGHKADYRLDIINNVLPIAN